MICHEVFILKQVMKLNLNTTNMELAIVQPGENFHMFTKEELKEN
jgi:20S proteasome subunit alpha 5